MDGNPIIILGGELGNSSATTPQYMPSIWVAADGVVRVSVDVLNGLAKNQ